MVQQNPFKKGLTHTKNPTKCSHLLSPGQSEFSDPPTPPVLSIHTLCLISHQGAHTSCPQLLSECRPYSCRRTLMLKCPSSVQVLTCPVFSQVTQHSCLLALEGLPCLMIASVGGRSLCSATFPPPKIPSVASSSRC